MERVLSSTGRQEALVRLMSSDPSLLSGLDDELLASITLLSEDPRARNEDRPSSNRLTEMALGRSARKNVQLYPEDAVFAEKKPAAIRGAKRAMLARAGTVLLSPSSNAAAVAATESTKQDAKAAAITKGGVKKVVTSLSPVVLLGDSVLNQAEHTVGRTESMKKQSRKKQSRGRKQNSSTESGSGNSEDDQQEESYISTSKRGIFYDESNAVSSSRVVGSMSYASDSDEGPQIANSSIMTTSPDSKPNSTSRILLDHHLFVSRDQWVARSARKACYVCMRDFNVLRKRHSCRMCGEVICSRCSVFREVNLPVVDNKFRICSCCFMSYRKKAEEADQQQQEDEVDNPYPTSQGSFDRGRSMDQSPSTHDELSSETDSQSEPFPRDIDTIPILQALPSDIVSDHSSSRNTMNTMSEFSFSSDSTFDISNYLPNSFSAPRSTEDELEAVLKAKELEKEVEASQQRIEALEKQIANQESQQDLLSTEQQAQLHDARSTIKLLQEKLRVQELSARQAAYNRDSICLSKLRQTELYASEDDESAALKKKLKVLERQLKQAGISVAEVIPYEVAKRKVEEISRRLQEIGSSEVVLENKQAQAASRKEYYILEQEMEKYHMALVMTDEYIEEQRRQEREWEEDNQVANLNSVQLLRSAIPVNISQLSEKDLINLTSPTKATFPAELARRLKRTNVLQLLRTDPKIIVKMHPSVIESYRTTGLTLLERRALHHVLRDPFQEWKKQQKDDMAQKKYSWYCKLKGAFVTAASNFQRHCECSGTAFDMAVHGDDDEAVMEQHSCKLLGLACPVRAEERVRKLYCGLGFSPEPDYFKENILKSDPEGAGEKALLEAQSHAREVVANQRQRDLKDHYKINMREVAQAVGALEEMDTILERIRELDDTFPCSLPKPPTSESARELHERNQLSQCTTLLNCTRELALLLAKRAGICLTGKRNRANDEEDTRSPVEIMEASRSLDVLQQILIDINDLLFDNGSGSKFAKALGTFKAIQELVADVSQKNLEAFKGAHKVSLRSVAAVTKQRVPWKERQPHNGSNKANDSDHDSNATHPPRQGSSIPPKGNPAVLPTSALLFDAIKARRKQADRPSAVNSSPTAVALTMKPGLNKSGSLMDAIRARKRAQTDSSTDVVKGSTSAVDAAKSA